MQNNEILQDKEMNGMIVRNESEWRNDVEVFWDMDGMEKELELRVYGQKDAIGNLTQSLQRAISDIKNNQSNPKMFFLLGGPGVGKHLVLEIIQKHIKCQYKDEIKSNMPCEIEYKNRKNDLKSFDQIFVQFELMQFKNYSESSVTFANINKLEFYLKSAYPHDYTLFREMVGFDVKNPKSLYFITGPIMSATTLDKFYEADEYSYYVQSAAKVTRQFSLLHFPVFDTVMIEFNPLGYEVVHQCLMDKQVSSSKIQHLLAAHNHTDFIPQGCKTR
jgi:hypothetical protein